LEYFLIWDSAQQPFDNLRETWPTAENAAVFHNYERLSHHTRSMHVQDDVLYNARRCNNFQIKIHLMTAGLLNIAIFQHLKCQDQWISRTCKSIFISCSSRNLCSAWGCQKPVVSDSKRSSARR